MTYRSALLLVTAISIFGFSSTRSIATAEGPLAFSATLLVQNAGSPSGANLSVPAPKKYAVTTKSLLGLIAVGLTNAHFYSGPVPYPAGTLLMVQSTGGAQVMGAHNFFVLSKDKSSRTYVNSMLYSTQNPLTVISGTLTPQIKPAPKLIYLTTDVLHFTDTLSNFNSTSFSFTTSGAYSQVWSLGAINRISGLQKETISTKVTGTAGNCTYQNNPAYVSGGYSSTGTAMVQ